MQVRHSPQIEKLISQKHYKDAVLHLLLCDWRAADADDYLSALFMRDAHGNTMAVRCERAAIDMVLPEPKWDKALEARMIELDQIILSDHPPLPEVWSLQRVLRTLVVEERIAVNDALSLVAATNHVGANFMHQVASRPEDWASYCIFLQQMLVSDLANKQENIHIVITMLNQRMGAYPCIENKINRPIDLVPLKNNEIHAYVNLMLDLAMLGVPREQIANLLQVGKMNLLPQFIQQAHALPPFMLLNFIQSGYLSKAELAQFAEHKAELLECILQDENHSHKMQNLNNVINPAALLGHLFLQKAKNEFQSLSKNRGLLKIANDALTAMRPAPIELLDDFVVLGECESARMVLADGSPNGSRLN